MEQLPCDDEYFDAVVNTIALLSYPDGASAMSEMRRVLREESEELRAKMDHDIDADALIALGAAHGSEFTHEDLRVSTELTDVDLDTVV